MTRIDAHVHVITPRYEKTLSSRPPQPVEDYKRFMERYGIDTLGLDGVALFSNHAGSYLGDPAWDVVFAELDRRGAYAFVHPATPPTGLVLPNYPRWHFEYPFDTTRALVNLIYTGALERYPNIKLQFAHLGGTSLFLAHRIASLEDREPQKASLAPDGALEYLCRQYYDTGLSNNMAALASALEVTTLDRIVFGSDWPYLALPPANDPSEDFDLLDPADRAKIDGGNAAALVPRLADAGSGQPVVVDSQRHGGRLQ